MKLYHSMIVGKGETKQILVNAYEAEKHKNGYRLIDHGSFISHRLLCQATNRPDYWGTSKAQAANRLIVQLESQARAGERLAENNRRAIAVFNKE